MNVVAYSHPLLGDWELMESAAYEPHAAFTLAKRIGLTTVGRETIYASPIVPASENLTFYAAVGQGSTAQALTWMSRPEGARR